LAEEHGGRLHDAATRRARRKLAVRLDPRVHLVARVGDSAPETARACRVAVQLDHAVRRQAGALVKVVDVLRDTAVEALEPMELDEGQVRGVRPRRADHGIRHTAELPVFSPTGRAADEVPVRELARIESVPEASRAPKIRDAGLGADPRAREGDGPARADEQLGQLMDGAAHRRRRFQTRSATDVNHAPSTGVDGACRKPATTPANTRAPAAASATLVWTPSIPPHREVTSVNRALLTT